MSRLFRALATVALACAALSPLTGQAQSGHEALDRFMALQGAVRLVVCEQVLADTAATFAVLADEPDLFTREAREDNVRKARATLAASLVYSALSKDVPDRAKEFGEAYAESVLEDSGSVVVHTTYCLRMLNEAVREDLIPQELLAAAKKAAEETLDEVLGPRLQDNSGPARGDTPFRL